MEVVQVEERLLNFINNSYESKDWPCLRDQYLRFRESKPLKGNKILSATPIFKNFYAKLLPLIAGGAEVTIASPSFVSPGSDVVNNLKELGLSLLSSETQQQEFDYVLDCGGEYCNLKTKGSVELTKTGEARYLKSISPWISVDESNAKKIEDTFGTSDGLVRALRTLGFNEFGKYKILIIGFGKVGSGCCHQLKRLGAEVFIIDPLYKKESIDEKYFTKINELGLDFAITATGVSSVIKKMNLSNQFKNPLIKLVNLGVEDEWGSDFQSQEILNNKLPINFMLEEPTKLKFLDPTFALQNECLLSLGEISSPGKNAVPGRMDDYYCDIFHRSNP